MLRRRMLVPTVSGYYRQVEYIESSGSQYVKTGIIPNGIRVEGSFSLNTNSGNHVVLGSRRVGGITSNSDCFVLWGSVNRGSRSDYGLKNNSTYYASFPLLSANTKVFFTKEGNITTVNDSSYSSTLVTINSTNELSLFALNEADSPINFGIFKLFYLKIFVLGVIQHDFIPVILTSDIPDSKCADPTLTHTTGTAGLWDLVEDKFYGNSGTGSFTYA